MLPCRWQGMGSSILLDHNSITRLVRKQISGRAFRRSMDESRSALITAFAVPTGARSSISASEWRDSPALSTKQSVTVVIRRLCDLRGKRSGGNLVELSSDSVPVSSSLALYCRNCTSPPPFVSSGFCDMDAALATSDTTRQMGGRVSQACTRCRRQKLRASHAPSRLLYRANCLSFSVIQRNPVPTASVPMLNVVHEICNMLPVTDVRLEHNQDVKSGPINLQSAEWTLMSQSMCRRLTFL